MVYILLAYYSNKRFYHGFFWYEYHKICNSNSAKYIFTDYRFCIYVCLIGWRSLIKPYILTTVAIGTSVTGGDLICQYLESHKKGPDGKRVVLSSSSMLSWWDRERSRVMCTTAVLVSTPWSFTLARVVERLFPGTYKLR